MLLNVKAKCVVLFKRFGWITERKGSISPPGFDGQLPYL